MLAKKKATKYQALKATEEGHKFLKANLKAVNQRTTKEAKAVSPLDKQCLVKGCLENIKKQCDHLASMGYETAIVTGEPFRVPYVLGTPKAMSCLKKSGVVEQFPLAMTNNSNHGQPPIIGGGPGEKDTLRHCMLKPLANHWA